MADLFTKQVRFYGKHGQYVESLVSGADAPSDDEHTAALRKKLLFDSYWQIYVVAPLVGYLYERKAERDGNTGKRSIFAEEVAHHKSQIEFSYELVNILDKESDPDFETRLRQAFQANDDLADEGFELFESYVRGGIEVLYENLVEDTGGNEAVLLDKVANFVDDFYSRFNEKIGGPDIETILRG